MKSNDEQQYLSELLLSIKTEQLAHIDFDQLRDWLTRQRDEEKLTQSLQSELDLIREDYRARIAGMAKAIAVTDRKRQALKQALDLIAGLSEMDSAELVKCYGQVAARFRDIFPASGFNHLARQFSSGQPKDYQEFK